ncbi:MAG: colD-shock DNA-binding protein [Ramlibacter sp.]|nr:colD-shock DNA-binding protein [Ramlibacter sp.]
MATYVTVLVWSVWAKNLPWWVLPASFAINLFTFFAYWQDKWAAGQGNWRISESTLHLWSLAGGWPGAWFAQQVLRHKSSKPSFRETYWATVVLNLAALGASIWWLPGWLVSQRADAPMALVALLGIFQK